MKPSAHIDSKNRNLVIADGPNKGLTAAYATSTPRGWYWIGQLESRSARTGVATLQLALAKAATALGYRLVDVPR